MKKHFHALLISCSTGNDKEDKKHDTELRHLEGELEDSWDVGKCNSLDFHRKIIIIQLHVLRLSLFTFYISQYISYEYQKKKDLGLT